MRINLTKKDIINSIYMQLGFSKLIAGHDYFLAYCPERLYPGDTYNEIVNNEHIIGGFTKDCGLEISKFYKRYENFKI